MKDNHLEKIWTKSFISISLTQFLIFTVFYTLLTTLPIYVIDHLNQTQSNAGLVVTFMLIAAILIRPFSAKIIDTLGKKKSLVLSVTIYAITTFVYMFMDHFTPLLTLRFIHGLSFGVVTTATGAIAANIIPKSRHGAGMGYFAMAMNIAMVVGPFIGLMSLQFITFKSLFIVLSILMVFSVLFSMFVKIDELKVKKDKDIASYKLNLSDLIELKALPVALISGLVGFSYASILSFVPVYAESISLSSAASYFFLVFAVVMIVFRPFLGRMFDERGPRVVLVPSLITFAMGLGLLSFTKTSLVLLVAAGFIGLGYGTLLPGFQTIAVQKAGYHRSSHAISTFFICYDIGIAFGAYVWGLIVAGYGFESMYILSALLVIITVLIFNAYLGRSEKSDHVKEEIHIKKSQDFSH